MIGAVWVNMLLLLMVVALLLVRLVQAIGRRASLWLGVVFVVVVGIGFGWNQVGQYRLAQTEARVNSVVDGVDSVIDMGVPVRESAPSKKCQERFAAAGDDTYCERAGDPAWATAVYAIEGRGPVEVIDVVYERLIAAGYRLTWGPYCDFLTGGVGAVFRTPEGYGVLVERSDTMDAGSYDPDRPWHLRVTATVDYGSGQPLPPDGYRSRPPNVLERCGPGS